MKYFYLSCLAAFAFFLASCNVFTPGIVGAVIGAGLSSSDIISPKDDECFFRKKSDFVVVNGSLCVLGFGILPTENVLYFGGLTGTLKLDLKNGTRKLLNYRTVNKMISRKGKIYTVGRNSNQWFYFFKNAYVFSFDDEETFEEEELNRYNEYWYNFVDIDYFGGEWYFHDFGDVYVIRKNEKKSLTGEIRGSDCDEGGFEEAEIGSIGGFLVAGDAIYVTDPGCGYLRKIDPVNEEIVNLDGKFEQTRHVAKIGNVIYYTVEESVIRYFDLETNEKGV